MAWRDRPRRDGRAARGAAGPGRRRDRGRRHRRDRARARAGRRGARRARPARAAGRDRRPRALQRAGPHRLGGLGDRHRRARRRRRHGLRRDAAQRPPADRRRRRLRRQGRGGARAARRSTSRSGAGSCPGPLDRLDELAERGVVGFKAFMCDTGIDDFEAADDDALGAGMERAAALGLPVAVHAERPAGAARDATARTGARGSPRGRPAAELAAIEQRARARRGDRLLAARRARLDRRRRRGRRRRRARAASTPPARPARTTSCSTEDDLERLGTLAKCAPPLRPAAERDALWEQLARGRIALVASDHSPCPPEHEGGRVRRAPGAGSRAPRRRWRCCCTRAPRAGCRSRRSPSWSRARPPRRFGLRKGAPGAGRGRRPRARGPARRARRRAPRPPPGQPVRRPRAARPRGAHAAARTHRVRGRPRRARRARPPAHPRGEDLQPMSDLTITAGPFAFEARWEREDAPEDLRGVRGPAAVPPEDHPRALERRVRVDPARRHEHRARVREPHEPPGAGRDPALPGRLQRDRDPVPLRRHAVREQDGPARRQPLPHDHRRAGSSCASSGAPCCGRARWTSSSRRCSRWAARTGSTSAHMPAWAAMDARAPG